MLFASAVFILHYIHIYRQECLHHKASSIVSIVLLRNINTTIPIVLVETQALLYVFYIGIPA
ncbi:MAG: hypothetical protein ACP5UA_09445 [Candidatus Hydrogenedens sp.]